MQLEAGTRLGHYEVLSSLGAGGMGEVYRARDTKLGREVAIKLLLEEVSTDPERLARFEREARVLASLNHNNIATLHGFEKEGDTSFLVMELVEGETLADRIKRGAIPVDEALPLFLQIAEGLEAAHEKGVIHRDLKPANINVSDDGQVKILDFGLAKAMAQEIDKSDPSMSMSPTLTLAATQRGEILGTAAYMSPEQASGEEIDKRADIWAFGVCLYEVLTGTRLFGGDKMSMVLASVLKDEADLDLLPADTPPSLVRLLRRCLKKEAGDRLHDMADARLELRDALTEPSLESPASGSVTAAPQRRSPLPWTLAALLAVAVAVTLWRPWVPPSRPAPVARLNVELSPGAVLFRRSGIPVAISPDGVRIAFVAAGQSNPSLMLRSLERTEAIELSGTGGAARPAFSPDGQWVAFFADETLKKVSISGGAPLALADADNSRGLAWSPLGWMVFAPTPTSGLWRVPDSGGPAEELVPLDTEMGDESLRWPHVLPGGEAFLFTSHGRAAAFSEANIEVFQLESGERKLLHRGGTHAHYISTGHIVFLREASLFALPFDLDRLEVTGSAAPLQEGVRFSENQGDGWIAISQNGTLLYVPGGSLGVDRVIVTADSDGEETELKVEAALYSDLQLSPDGTKLALTIGDTNDNSDVWVYDLERGTMTRLTFSEADHDPVWSPDGRRIAFASGRDGDATNVYVKAADGSEDVERLTTSELYQEPQSWSPDAHIAVEEFVPGSATKIATLALDGNDQTVAFVDTEFRNVDPAFSPDGRWLAYASLESGRMHIYVRAFPGPGGKWQISSGDGPNLEPVWSADGNSLYYWTPSSIIEVPIAVEGDSLRAGKLEVVLEGTYRPPFGVARDGRFFLIRGGQGDAQQAEISHVTLVLNWLEEVKRLVPTD